MAYVNLYGTYKWSASKYPFVIRAYDTLKNPIDANIIQKSDGK